MGRQGMALVDGRGAARVARELVAADLRLRPVRREDSAAIYYWRNHPDNRRHALMTAPITVEEHARWFTVGLANADRIMLLAEDNGAPVGVLRYDLVGDSATVSIYTVPGMAGRGYGRRMLLAGEDWLARQRPALASLRAEVRTANEASIGAFRAANYDHAESVFTKDIRGNA
jgi:RimJ/RimL family protein N-acetyltransferase